MAPQCLSLLHTAAPKAQQTLHRPGRDGWGGRSRRRKAEASEHSHGYSHRQEGGICPRPAPSNLRELPSAAGEETPLDSRRKKSQPGYTRTVGQGEKQHRAVTSESSVEGCRAAMEMEMAALGWSFGVAVGTAAGPEEAAVTRLMRGQSCAELHRAGAAQEAPGSALLSDFSHHRQFHFKGAAASKPFALLLWGKMQKDERVNHLQQRELEGNDYWNEISTTSIPAFPKPPKTPGEKCGCPAQKEARGCLAP